MHDQINAKHFQKTEQTTQIFQTKSKIIKANKSDIVCSSDSHRVDNTLCFSVSLSHLCKAYLKVVPEGPGAQHLKKGVMVHILPHVIQVIVLASCTNALLGVGSTLQSGHGV